MLPRIMAASALLYRARYGYRRASNLVLLSAISAAVDAAAPALTKAVVAQLSSAEGPILLLLVEVAVAITFLAAMLGAVYLVIATHILIMEGLATL